MPTTISNVGAASASMRWNEPYVSDGLNKKLMGLVGGTGVVRGGRLVSTGIGLNVSIEADPSEEDSVYSYINVDGRQLTVRQAGSVSLNLAPFAGLTVYIALYVEYAIGAATVVEWRAYTEAELFGGAPVAEAAFVVVLGQVVVPGAGPIPDANVTPTKRRAAWEALGRDAVRWEQIVLNPGFEVGPAGATVTNGDIPHWTPETLSLAGSAIAVADVSGEAHTGARFLEIDSTAAAGVLEVEQRQNGWIPVSPGQHARVSVWLKGDAWGGLTSSAALRLRFYDENFTVIASADVSADFGDLSGTFDWTERFAVGEVPAGARFATVRLATFSNPNVPSGRLLIDDAHVYMEPLARASHDQQHIDQIRHHLATGLSFVENNAETQADGLGTFLTRLISGTYDGSESPPGMIFKRGLGVTSEFLFRLTKGVIEASRIRNLGEDLLGVAANAAIARLHTVGEDSAIALLTLLWEIPNLTAGSPTVRIYSEAPGGLAVTGGLAITVNARWDSGTSQWVRDVAGDAIKVTYGSGRVRTYTHDVLDGASWFETTTAGNWDRFSGIFHTSFGGVVGLDYGHSGRFGFNEVNGFSSPQSTKPVGTTVFGVNNPVSGRKIYNTSLIKSWGRIVTDGSSTLDGVQLQDGFNLNRVQVSGTGHLLIDFWAALANAEYVVLAASADGTARVYSSFNELVGGFEIRAYDMAGAAISLRTTALEMTFAVIGRD